MNQTPEISPASEGSIHDVVTAASRFAAAGDFRQALQQAQALGDAMSLAELEFLVAQWRRKAFSPASVPAHRREWPPLFQDPAPQLQGIYEIPASELTIQTLAGGITHHGGVLVRGWLDPQEARELAHGIDMAFEDKDRVLSAQQPPDFSPWYRRHELELDPALIESRLWVESAEAILAADSPRMLARWIETCRRKGLVDIIAQYLGEDPVLSIGKTTLRRVPASLDLAQWHQDGAFLGRHVHAVNVWVALSHCGVEASGLDILPRRTDGILPTGTHGAIFDWCIGDGVVDEARNGLPIATPAFAPGDVMIFDQLLVHKTGLPAGRTKTRWAIESWFFGTSSYPEDQGPMVL